MFALSLASCQKNTSDKLLELNNVTMPSFEQIESIKNNNDTLKILVLGNSITSHGMDKSIGWKHESGMAASNINKDFVHLLFKKIHTQTPQKNIIFRYSNFSEFERDPIKLPENSINEIAKFNPNILIYQLGDNLTIENSLIFKESSIKLLNMLTNTQTYVVSPFFQNESNFEITNDISKESNSTFIDISLISKDPTSKAINEKDYPLKKSEWKVDGIGLHPGDIGMAKIADEILKNMQY